MKPDLTYIGHICDAIDKVSDYLKGISYEQFKNDDKTKDAVVRNLEIIGEATKNISLGTKETSSDIPWKYMARIRDRLIHEYFGVDYAVVWQVAAEELPKIRKKLEILKK